MKYLKIKNHRAYTPIITLTLGKRTVVIIGVIHIATRNYFVRLQRLLEKLEQRGWAVLYERLADDVHPQKKLRRLSNEVHRLLMELWVLFMNKHNLCYQAHALKKGRNWIDADLPSQERDELYNVSMEQLIRTRKYLRVQLKNPASWISDMARLLTNPVAVVDNTYGRLPRKARALLVDKRDRFAARLIVRHNQVQPVVTYWGAFHIPGIVRELKNRGFRTKSVTWTPAFRIHPPPKR